MSLFKRVFSGTLVALLITCVLTLAFNIHLLKAEPETIIVPDDYPTIQQAVDAANSGDIIYVRAGIYHERVRISDRSNLQIIGEDSSNTAVDTVGMGAPGPLWIYRSSNITIKGFSATGESYGSIVELDESLYCNISANEILGGGWGVLIGPDSHFNSVNNNMIKDGTTGVEIYGGQTYYSTDNVVECNSFFGQSWSISINDFLCQYNVIFHNNFFNYSMAWNYGGYNKWDDGCPSGGNYWSDYTGTDLYGGPYQNETYSDGIGDTPYIIQTNNRDNYPLLNPYGGSYNSTIEAYCGTEGREVNVGIILDGSSTGFYTPHTFTDLTGPHTFTVPNIDADGHPFCRWSTGSRNTTILVSSGVTRTAYYGISDVAITEVSPSKTAVGQSYCTCINVTAANKGSYAETFDITVYVNTTVIGTQTVNNLLNGTSTVLAFAWNTSGFAKGYYTTSAYACSVENETDLDDNTLIDGLVLIGVPCDITGPTPLVPDGVCNMRDIGYIVGHFGTTPSSPNWDSNCDVTGPEWGVPDDIVNMRDIGEACNNFMNTDP
jgi:hypothetical protein